MSARARIAAAALAVGLAGAPGLAPAQSDKVPVIGWLGSPPRRQASDCGRRSSRDSASWGT